MIHGEDREYEEDISFENWRVARGGVLSLGDLGKWLEMYVAKQKKQIP